MAAIKLLDISDDIKSGAKLKLVNAKTTVAITEALGAEDVIGLIQSSGLRHIVQKDGLAFAEELATAQKMLSQPKEFLDNPFETIFGSQNQISREHFAHVCEASTKKTQILTSFGDFVAGVKGSRTIWDKALLVADELFTNASKNAWDPSTALFSGPAVRTGQIEFFAQADGVRLVIACRDNFGKLDVDGVIARIATCFKNGVGQSIRNDTAGAGIGSHMVFDACASYYAGSQKDKSTLVCVSLPLGLSRRSASGLFKNIHLLP